MIRILQKCFTLLFIIPTIMGMIFFYGCSNEKKKVELISEKVIEPVEVSYDIKLIYSDSAKLKMVLKAPIIERYIGDQPYSEFKKGINVVFFNPSGSVNSSITANYAKDFRKSNTMEAEGNVVVINKKGDKLETEQLIWDKKNHQIKSDEFVKITTPDEILYGDGLEATDDFTSYKILNIRGIVNIKENE